MPMAFSPGALLSRTAQCKIQWQQPAHIMTSSNIWPGCACADAHLHVVNKAVDGDLLGHERRCAQLLNVLLHAVLQISGSWADAQEVVVAQIHTLHPIHYLQQRPAMLSVFHKKENYACSQYFCGLLRGGQHVLTTSADAKRWSRCFTGCRLHTDAACFPQEYGEKLGEADRGPLQRTSLSLTFLTSQLWCLTAACAPCSHIDTAALQQSRSPQCPSPQLNNICQLQL